MQWEVWGFYFGAILPKGELTLPNNFDVANLSENQRTGCLLAYDFIFKKNYRCYKNFWLCNFLLAKMIDYRNYYFINSIGRNRCVFLKDRSSFLFVRVGNVPFSCWKEHNNLCSSWATAFHTAIEQPVIIWWLSLTHTYDSSHFLK